MKYAVIKIANRQYKVCEGDELLVSKIGKSDVKADTLLFVDEKTVKIGKPDLGTNKVSLKVVEESLKGKKVSVLKYKAKSRYRKKIGFRPRLTKLLVTKIS
jgi:large subunit ribosomal protein L21